MATSLGEGKLNSNMLNSVKKLTLLHLTCVEELSKCVCMCEGERVYKPFIL